MNEQQNSNLTSADSNGGDLDWMAFQYISGELTADQAATFEGRLAIDQEAREAVARAVELAETTALAFDSVPTVVTPIRWWAKPAVFAAGGVAAAIAIGVSLMGLLPSPSRNGNGVQMADGQGEVRELAMAWATGRTDLVAETSAAAEEAFAGSGTSGDEVETIETPSWMLVAVAALTHNGPTSPQQDEQDRELN